VLAASSTKHRCREKASPGLSDPAAAVGRTGLWRLFQWTQWKGRREEDDRKEFL